MFSFFSSLFCGVVEDGIQAVPPRATNPSKHIHTQCFEPKLYFISTVQCINSYTNTKLGKVVSILSQNCLCIFKIILILIHLVDRALFLVSTTSLVDAPVHLQVVLTWCFQLWFLIKSFVLRTRRDRFQVVAFLRSLEVNPAKENVGIVKVERDQTTRLNHVTHLHLIFKKRWK